MDSFGAVTKPFGLLHNYEWLAVHGCCGVVPSGFLVMIILGITICFVLSDFSELYVAIV